jgi:hypothetical protein
MIIDVQTKISEYFDLIEAISEQIDNPEIAMVVLQELRKDMRTEEMRQSRDHAPTGNFPATENQIAYMARLGINAPEGVTKQQASELIDRARAKKESTEIMRSPIRIP